MELTNEFVVPVPVSEAWAVLTDVERIAPCMPGAELKEVEGDEYRGLVKVKVGPITASYKGAARFVEQDEATHRAVLKAEGRETRGQGNASATITATLTPAGEGTKVDVVTDLAITGKVAQFGRGVLAEVSGKLLDQFVRNLEATVLLPAEQNGSDPPASAVSDPPASAVSDPPASAVSDPPASAVSDPPASAVSDPTGGAIPDVGEGAAASDKPSTPRTIHSSPAEPVDLLGVAGPSMRKRIVPFASVAGVLVLLRIVVYALRRRKR